MPCIGRRWCRFPLQDWIRHRCYILPLHGDLVVEWRHGVVLKRARKATDGEESITGAMTGIAVGSWLGSKAG